MSLLGRWHVWVGGGVRYSEVKKLAVCCRCYWMGNGCMRPENDPAALTNQRKRPKRPAIQLLADSSKTPPKPLRRPSASTHAPTQPDKEPPKTPTSAADTKEEKRPPNAAKDMANDAKDTNHTVKPVEPERKVVVVQKPAEPETKVQKPAELETKVVAEPETKVVAEPERKVVAEPERKVVLMPPEKKVALMNNIFRGPESVNWGGGVDPRTNGELWLWSLLEPHVSTMVDVGIYKELTFPDNGKTMQHCFEANPSFCKDLKKYESPTIIMNNVGLGSSAGKIRYYAHGETMHFRTMFGCSLNCKCSQIVDVVTLDEYCEKKGITVVDFIKIDVEGHELEVLKGAAKILQSTEFVQFEAGGTYHDAKIKLGDVYEFLGKYGFTHFYLVCPTYLALCPTPIENYKYSNYLATRGEPTILIPEQEQ